MTLTHIFEIIRDAGCKRAMLIEFKGQGMLDVFIPAEHIQEVALAIEQMRPVGIVVNVRPLPWWRCWFVEFQFVSK